MTWLFQLLTSFGGRISRKDWWIGLVVIQIISIAGVLTFDPSYFSEEVTPAVKPSLWHTLWEAALFVPTLAITLKRLNDRDHPRLLVCIYVSVALVFIVAFDFGIPDNWENFGIREWTLSAPVILFSLWVFIDNGFLKGTQGPNRYGPDPLGSKTDQAAANITTTSVKVRSTRSIGVMARDAIVGVLGLTAVLYLTLPGLSLESTGKWLAQAISSLTLDGLEDEMRGNPQGWQAFEAGKAAARQKKYSEAVSNYDRALEHYGKKSKSAGRVFMWRGYSLRNLGKLYDALSDFNAAIVIDPDASSIRYSARARIYRKLKHYEAALEDYDEAIRLWPEYANYYLRRGDMLLKLGRLEQALEAYQNCIVAARKRYERLERKRRFTDNLKSSEGKRSRELELRKLQDAELERRDKLLGRVNVSRGIALRDLGRVDDALAAFDEAILLRPTYISAYRNRGWLHTHQDRLNLARADYERGLKLLPDDTWLTDALKSLEYPDVSIRTQIKVANELRDRKRYQLALDVYNNALEKKPDYVFALLNRGWLHQLQNKLDEALVDYERAVELDNDHVDAHIYRGKAYEELDKFDKAAADYEQAFHLKPDHWRAYLWRAWLYYRQKQLDLSLADYTRLIEIKPRLDDAYLYRGKVYRDLGQFENALADYNKAQELSPGYVDVYQNRGWLYFQKGRYNLARADYERGLKLAPDNKWLLQATIQLEKKVRK